MNLFIDTHLNDVIVILTDKEDKIVKSEIVQNVKQNSTIIMPIIKKIITGVTLDSIIVVNGPGSFTGVRMGVTIAKTLAYTLDIPIRTITSLECMAINVETDDKIVAFSDNNGYYLGTFDKDNMIIGNYKYLSKEEFTKFSNDNLVSQKIEIDYEKVIEFALKKDVINPHKVNPIYIKKIDVEK